MWTPRYTFLMSLPWDRPEFQFTAASHLSCIYLTLWQPANSQPNLSCSGQLVCLYPLTVLRSLIFFHRWNKQWKDLAHSSEKLKTPPGPSQKKISLIFTLTLPLTKHHFKSPKMIALPCPSFSEHFTFWSSFTLIRTTECIQLLQNPKQPCTLILPTVMQVLWKSFQNHHVKGLSASGVLTRWTNI